MNRRLSHNAVHRRRGSMVPALAMALFVVGGAMAFVFDRLWQDAAEIELRTAGEAAALAAAGQLASDDTIRDDADWKLICETGRISAAEIAGRNSVGGVTVSLDSDPNGDVRFGKLVDNAIGERVFVETTSQPNVVYVRARQGRGSSNPVGLLVRDLSGAGRLLQVIVGATAENHIAGVRPYAGVNVPAIPIAIYAGNAATAAAGWNGLIEGRGGPDAWRVADDGRSLEQGADRIHEMTAISAPDQADEKEQLLATVHVIDVGTGLSEEGLRRQCREGWSQDDLADHYGELRCDGGPLTFTSKPKISSEIRVELSKLIGQTRLCWLFDSALPTTNRDRCQLSCGRLVAIRILGVQAVADGMLSLELQPAVIATRTALVSETGDERLMNPYVYKVFLSE
jgi:hypothetical protein